MGKETVPRQDGCGRKTVGCSLTSEPEPVSEPLSGCSKMPTLQEARNTATGTWNGQNAVTTVAGRCLFVKLIRP